MKKQLKPMIILGSILVLLVAVYLFATLVLPNIGSPEETTETTTGTALAPILETDFADVSYLEIVNESDTYRLIPESVVDDKGEKSWSWSVEGFEDYPFSDSLLSRLATVAAEAFVKTEIESESDDLTIYGLAEPRAIMRVVHKSGEVHEIKWGSEVPSDNYDYATVDDTGRVCMISSISAERVRSSLMDLLDKDQVIGFDQNALTGLSFERAKDEIRLVTDIKLMGDIESEQTYLSFTVEEPLKRDANSDNLTKLVTEATAISVKSFVAFEPEDLSVYGLEEPAYSFELTTKDQTVTLMLGSEAADDSFYAMSSRLPAVFTVSRSAFTVLDMKVTEMIDRFVALESIWTVSKIEGDIQGTRFVTEIQMTEQQKATDDDVIFMLDGQDARIFSERNRSLFSSFYQRLISVVIEGIEPDADPVNTKDSRLIFHLKADTENNVSAHTKTIEFAKRNQYTDYVFIDGVYAGFYIDTEKAFTSSRVNSEGIIVAYKQMKYAIEHADDGVFNTQEGYQLD